MGGDNEAWADREHGNGGGSRGDLHPRGGVAHLRHELEGAPRQEVPPRHRQPPRAGPQPRRGRPARRGLRRHRPRPRLRPPVHAHQDHVHPGLACAPPRPAPHLRIWRIASPDDGDGPPANASSGSVRRNGIAQPQQQSAVDLRCELNSNRSSDYCGPLTSFDWNNADPRRIGTSTIWDVERESVDTQLIAPDKEVYGFAWGSAGVFASVSADDSVRVFDLRDKEHSTIMYESGSGGDGGGSNSGAGDGRAVSPAPLVRLGGGTSRTQGTWVEQNFWRRKHRNLIKSLDIYLKTIGLKNYRGIMSQVNFATFFILNAKLLELMRFEGGDYCNDEMFIEKQQRLLQLEERASRGPRLLFATDKSGHGPINVKNVRDLSITDPFACGSLNWV